MDFTKNDKPLVSIIMPAYNGGAYIEDAVKSVILQSYTNWELLIIDDQSSDNSLDIAYSFSKTDERIRVIALKKNSGVANARNVGIGKSTGDYIAFLDSDDCWKKDKLSKQIKFMEENNYSFTFSSAEIMNENGEPLNKIRTAPSQIDYKTLLKGNPINCLTVIIKKADVENIMMPLIKHEDYATWLNLLQRNNILYAYGMKESLAYYRVSNNSVSSNKVKTLKWTWNIFFNHQKLGLIKSMIYMFLFTVNTSFKHISYKI